MSQFVPPDNTPPGLTKPAVYNPADEAEWVEPPSWPTAVGVISIIIGSLFTLCGAFSLMAMPFMPSLMKSVVPPGEELPPTMQLGPLQWVVVSIGLIFSIVLIIAGIACVRRKYITRWLHLTYALFGFLATPVNIYLQIDTFNKMKVWGLDHPNSVFVKGQSSTTAFWGLIGGIAFTLLWGLGWQSFCAIWFGAIKRRPIDFTGTVNH